MSPKGAIEHSPAGRIAAGCHSSPQKKGRKKKKWKGNKWSDIKIPRLGKRRGASELKHRGAGERAATSESKKAFTR